MPEHKPVPQGTFLGFDYGQKRLGVARGQSITCSANPLEIIPANKGIDWNRIQTLINDWQPVALVVGMPYTADGKTTPHLKRIEKFVAELKSRFELPVYTVDEHLSSYVAKDLLSQSTNRKIRALDDTAAAVILQTWLEG